MSAQAESPENRDSGDGAVPVGTQVLPAPRSDGGRLQAPILEAIGLSSARELGFVWHDRA